MRERERERTLVESRFLRGESSLDCRKRHTQVHREKEREKERRRESDRNVR